MTTTTRVDTYEWMRLVRRIRLTSPTKLIALTLATYANQDGTRIFPGVRRLTAVTGLSERSVRGAMKTLRDVGLIERTRVGSSMGRRALTDEHELAFPADLVQRLAAHRIGLLGPDESPAPDAGDEVYAQERTTCEQAGGNRSTPSSSPAGGAADDFGSPAPPAGSPAPPAGTPAGGAEITGTSCTPPTQLPTTYQPTTNRELTNVTTSRPREAGSDNVIALGQVEGLSPTEQARAAAAEAQRLQAAARKAPHCDHPDCDPKTRWRGDARCPECNELSILRRAHRPQLAVVGGTR